MLYILGGSASDVRRLWLEVRGIFAVVTHVEDEPDLMRALWMLAPLHQPVDLQGRAFAEGWRFAAARKAVEVDRTMVVVLATRDHDPADLLARVAVL